MVLRIRYESSWPGPPLALNEDGGGNNDDTHNNVKMPSVHTPLPVQSREPSGRTLHQDIACMILYNFTGSSKRPSEPHPVPPPLAPKSL